MDEDATDEATRTANGAADLLDDTAPGEDSSPAPSPSPTTSPADNNESTTPALATAANEEVEQSESTPVPTTATGSTASDDVISAVSNGSKPSIATVTAIVNEVLRQKESGAGANVDIASIASKEVDKFYDAEENSPEEYFTPPTSRQTRSHPWNKKDDDEGDDGEGEARSFFKRKGSRDTASIISSKIKSAIVSMSPKKSPTEDNDDTIDTASTPPPANMFKDGESADFNDLCEELGITAETHPHLRRPYRSYSSMFSVDNYYSTVQQILRSTNFKYLCMGVVCLLATIISIAGAVRMGFEHAAKRNNELNPTWMTEEKAKEDKDWWNKEQQQDESSKPRDPMQAYMDKKVKLSPEELNDLYYSLSDAYLPIWFDRSTGWDGTSYEEALEFCRAHDNFVPCPYDVYCPGQADKLIFNEVFDNEDMNGERTWAPILDDWNEWVQVGSDHNQCTTYSAVWHRRPTEWTPGLEHEMIKKMTSHIMCCLEQPLSDEFKAMPTPVKHNIPHAPPNVSEEHGEGVDDPIPPPPMNAQDEAEKESGDAEDTFTAFDQEVKDTYRPYWFDENDGYPGTTYDAGKAFCESIPNGANGETFHLCPIKAYCPNGIGAPRPLTYQMGAFGGGLQWAPVSNHINGWIMVGKVSEEEPNTCLSFLDLYQKDPDWGTDGSQVEIKKHILCCQVETGTDGSIKKAEVAGTATPIQGLPNEDVPIVQYLGGKPNDALSNSQANELANNQSGATEEEHKYMGEMPSHTGAGNSSPHAGEHVYDDPITAMKKTLNPTWYGLLEGWRGGTHTDGLMFCDAKNQQLCPYAAYCPSGATKPPLEGAGITAQETSMQWAPIINRPNQWVMIGLLDNNGSTQCKEYDKLNGELPSWGLDGSNMELKGHILCCTKTSEISSALAQQQQQQQQQEQESVGAGLESQNLSADVSVEEEDNDDGFDDAPAMGTGIWFHVKNGWNGGSHDDALHYCGLKEINGKRLQLCPYHEYCPSGPSRPPADGADVGSDGEQTEQWAPTSNGNNQWVMVGMKGHNRASQCLTHGQLNGEAPSWGLDQTNKEKKRYVMCCEVVENTAGR